jgi:hypothetical protein
MIAERDHLSPLSEVHPGMRGSASRAMIVGT